MRSLHIPQTSPKEVRDKICRKSGGASYDPRPHYTVGVCNPETYSRVLAIRNEVGREVGGVSNVMRRNEMG